MRTDLSVSVHFHHVVGISINYRRGENSIWRFSTDNCPPPPPAPNPKQRQFGPQQPSTSSSPLLSPLKGKGGACNQLHLKAPIAILPSHSQMQNNHGTFLLWDAPSNAAAVVMSLSLPPPPPPGIKDNSESVQSQRYQHLCRPNLAPISQCTLCNIFFSIQKRHRLNTSTKLGRKWWAAQAGGLASFSRVCPKTSTFVSCLVFPQNLQKLPGSWWRSMVCTLLVAVFFIFCGHLCSC